MGKKCRQNAGLRKEVTCSYLGGRKRILTTTRGPFERALALTWCPHSLQEEGAWLVAGTAEGYCTEGCDWEVSLDSIA